MEFTQRDMAILISMPLAIIILNFAFSGIGVVEDDISSNEIPKYNLPDNRFELADKFPKYPGNPAKGTLTLQPNQSNNNNNYRFLYETSTENYGIEIVKPIYEDGVDVSIFWQNETIYEDKTSNLANISDVSTIEYTKNDLTYKVRFELNNIRETNTYKEYQVNYHIQESPSQNDDSFAERIPVIGGMVSAGESLAQVLSWIGSIFSWFVLTIFEILISMVLTVAESVAYVIKLVTWILSSYNNIVTNANGFASVFVVIPGLLLSIELLKMGFIIIHLLPTT